MQVQKTVIIVAGGKGERMHMDVPKQFLELHGKPVLMHTIERFFSYDAGIKIVLVLPAAQIDFWHSLCEKHQFSLKHTIECGGATRFHSVKNGLNTVSLPALVAVHDGVRPLVDIETIERCFNQAHETGAAIPVTDLVDSIRKIDEHNSVAVNRADYKLVQTPQVFDGDLLLRAYEQDFSAEFTDDASVVEKLGHKISLVAGNRENIKITTSMDLVLAEYFLGKK